nr:MAG TPA: hypothetical protein [Caudoviricetes sp.]
MMVSYFPGFAVRGAPFGAARLYRAVTRPRCCL